MVNKKITELTAITSDAVADSDVFPIVDVSTSTTKKVTKSELAEAIGIANTPVDLTGLSDGDVLVHNGTRFEPAASLAVTPGTPTLGQVLTYGADGSYGPSPVPTPFNYACTEIPTRATSSLTLGAANRTYYMKVLYGRRNCTKIRLNAVTASGNISVGYASGGTAVFDTPQTIIVTSGSTTCPSGVSDITVSQFDCEVGGWLFISCDNNTAAFSASVTTGTINSFHASTQLCGGFNPSVGDVSGLSYLGESKLYCLIAY